MSQPLPPPPPEKSYLQKYKSLILVLSVTVVVMIILVVPVVPIQSTVTKTTARTLQYSSKMDSIYFAYLNSLPYFSSLPCVNVTNSDSVNGIFTVTIDYWNTAPELIGNAPSRVNTCTQSLFISAGDTKMFYPSNGGDWGLGFDVMFYGYTYSVSAPSVQENHYENQTEYKSILSLLLNR